MADEEYPKRLADAISKLVAPDAIRKPDPAELRRLLTRKPPYPFGSAPPPAPASEVDSKQIEPRPEAIRAVLSIREKHPHDTRKEIAKMVLNADPSVHDREFRVIATRFNLFPHGARKTSARKRK